MGYFLLNLTCSVCLYSEGHDHDVSSTDGNKNTEQTFFTQEKSVGSVYLAFSLTYNILVRQSRLQHMKNKIWRSKFPLKSWSCPIGKTMIGRHNNRILYVCVHVFMYSPVILCPHRKLQREETKREMGCPKDRTTASREEYRRCPSRL